MVNTGAHLMSAQAVDWEGSPGEASVDADLRGLGARYRVYDAADGCVFLAAPTDRDWERLVAALAGEVELGTDDRFVDADARRDADEALADVLAQVFRRRSADDWERDLLAAGVGCVAVDTRGSDAFLLDDEVGRQSGYVVDTVHPTFDQSRAWRRTSPSPGHARMPCRASSPASTPTRCWPSSGGTRRPSPTCATGASSAERRRRRRCDAVRANVVQCRLQVSTLRTRSVLVMAKIWANSGDSHVLEPDDLWSEILPPKLAERMPRSEKVADDEEVVHVDGQSFHRKLPKILTKAGEGGKTIVEMSMRPPGARDIRARLGDLDDEGIWAEVIYPSLGLWQNMIRDPALVRDATREQNAWIKSEIQDVAPNRLVPTAQLPMLSVQDAADEVRHAAEIGLHAVYIPTGVPKGMDDYNRDSWDPLWQAVEETGVVLAVHIGTDGNDQGSVYRGPGGALLNYVHSGASGQTFAMKVVSSGALDRYPGVKVLISEGGATWVPFIGDRLNEGYRQHGMFVKPKLSQLPKEILYRSVYASFQHDETAPAALSAMGYQNVLWGSDYPHLEGTFGHTQKTLHELFDDVDESVRYRITQGAFRELFPHVDEVPSASDTDTDTD